MSNPTDRPRYLVTLPDTDTPVEVTITHQDQLRAEVEGGRAGLPEMARAPMHWATYWCYTALRRTGVLDETIKWAAFRDNVVDITGLDDPEPVPPTREPSGSPSPWPGSGPASTGGHPTSTSG